jgi:hypothetical protein
MVQRPNKTKQNQTRPNKSKQNGLDLLGFIRPNRDFSMGYGESKQKNLVSSQAVRVLSQAHSFSFLLAPERAGKTGEWQLYSADFRF